MQIKCDTHTHTLFSRHAYSTIGENVQAAKEKGLELLASTDHYSSMLFPDAPPEEMHKNFQYLTTCCHIWPREWMGVTLLRGAEADIVDLSGNLYGYDIPVSHMIVGDPYHEGERSLLERMSKGMDYLIASVHGKYFTMDATRAQMTDMYIKALDHPKVLILGHIGRSGLDIEVDPILEAAKSKNKLIELNEHSFSFGEGLVKRCRHVAERCAELGVSVSIASDAHIACDIANFQKIPEMLTEIHFPEELVVSRDKAHFLEAIRKSGVAKDISDFETLA